MTASEIKKLAAERALDVARWIYPQGKKAGNNWVVGDINGSPGKSFGVYIGPGPKAGIAKEFGDSVPGCDNLVEVYARKNTVEFAVACQAVANFLGVTWDRQRPDGTPAKMNGNHVPVPQPRRAEPKQAPAPEPAKPLPEYPWEDATAGADDERMEKLASERALSMPFILWLVKADLLGFAYHYNKGPFAAFPIHDEQGRVVAAHLKAPNRSGELDWTVSKPDNHTLSIPTKPLVIGDIEHSEVVWVAESQWDALALLDRLKVQETGLAAGVAVFITRGAGNGKMVSRIAKPGRALVLWVQNDKPDEKGKVASERWARDCVEHAGPCRVLRVSIPAEYEDPDDWVRRTNPSAEVIARLAAKAECVREASESVPDGPDLAADPAEAPAPLSDLERPFISLMDIAPGPPDPMKTLLGNRFLCKGSGMLFVGPSGIGKSSASVQQDILWGLGREAFDIAPQRPLRILTIQSENDDDDLREMRDSVVRGLGLSAEETEIVRRNVFYETQQIRTGPDFLAYVDARMRRGQLFDLLRIDPLNGCLGADPTDTEKTMAFLRNGLNPILAKYDVGAIINHHTPKTTYRDTSGWRGSDWMYAAAGGADIVNWARAVLVIDPTYVPHVFKFIAAKRGARIDWRDADNAREIIRHFCHAEDGIYWRTAEEADLDAARAAAPAAKGQARLSAKTSDALKALVPMTEPIAKETLIYNAGLAGIGMNAARNLLKVLLVSGELFEWRIPRPRTNPAVHISRREQTLV
jgi:hypothetical protein